jgi:hypothetical protein
MADRAAARMEKSKSAPIAAPRFTIGERHHSAEAEAESVAKAVTSRSTPTAPSIAPQPDERSGSGAPASVGNVVKSNGRPLDSAVRSGMEQRFGHRFSDVRIHNDSAAASSANELDANAYTVGRNIVFNAGRYAPHSNEGRSLLAHELTHVVQNSGIKEPSIIRRQPKDDPKATAKAQNTQKSGGQTTGGVTAPVAARKDYVFIMGKDASKANMFYTLAERYFHAHVPNAQFVTSIRTLTDLLSWISTNVKDPIGNIFIVSHANEDGTLSFGINSADKDKRTSVPELRAALHPAGGGASALANVKSQIDAKTKIHIKGCDIGRTQEMVELLDEAFGGLGTVTAPTHEQVFGTDPQLEKEARDKLKADIESHHPMPKPVDPSLKGKDKLKATADRQKEVKHRAEDIKAETTARKAEGDRLAEEANTYEALSGPMFQRPGTKLFTDSEIKPQVDSLYTQLSDKQRADIVKGLVAPDKRPAAAADQNGTVGQHGQRVYKRTTLTYTMEDPQTAAEANALYAKGFREQHFTATADPIVAQTPVSGGFTVVVTVSGKQAVPGGKARNATLTIPYSSTIPNDAALMVDGKKKVPNPDRYAWRVSSSHSGGKTVRSVIGERVLAYLHHKDLDASPHKHFDPAETDPRFFATSTFDPTAKKFRTTAPPPKMKKP